MLKDESILRGTTLIRFPLAGVTSSGTAFTAIPYLYNGRTRCTIPASWQFHAQLRVFFQVYASLPLLSYRGSLEKCL